MKNPDYVYNVVSCYREALDAAVARVNAAESVAGATAATDAAGSDAGSDVAGAAEKTVRRLARSFNRGFTDGYLTGRTGANLMSWERSCNQGVRVGRVIDRRHEEVLVAFEDAVDAGDTLEVRFIPGPNTAKDAPKRWPMVPAPVDAAAGDSVWVRCKRKVEVGAQVNLVRSEDLIEVARERVAALRAAGPDPASGCDDAAGHRAAERPLSKNQGASMRRGGGRRGLRLRGPRRRGGARRLHCRRSPSGVRPARWALSRRPFKLLPAGVGRGAGGVRAPAAGGGCQRMDAACARVGRGTGRGFA